MKTNLKQNADYTFKHNIKYGRHGWIRLTPAYSLKVVDEIIGQHSRTSRVLDPFCGSGTTALCSAIRGLPSVTTDINPFLVWLAKTKTENYDSGTISSALSFASKVSNKNGNAEIDTPPKIHNIGRWWTAKTVTFFCQLRNSIKVNCLNEKVKDILKIAFCRTLIKLSNASFNHQSMSFKSSQSEFNLNFDYSTIFYEEVKYVVRDCGTKIESVPEVKLMDARHLFPSKLGKFDLVVTSPPYANRMSYVRELRPYMYWLGYFNDPTDAGELDWQAIGGTWGIATSRLNNWVPKNRYENAHLNECVSKISTSTNKNAKILSRYVKKYHEDIHEHLLSLTSVLNLGARVHYIVGNSSFYGTLVKVEEVYADMLKALGFSEIDVKAIRKRNSNKALIEYDVSATWKGRMISSVYKSQGKPIS